MLSEAKKCCNYIKYFYIAIIVLKFPIYILQRIESLSAFIGVMKKTLFKMLILVYIHINACYMTLIGFRFRQVHSSFATFVVAPTQRGHTIVWLVYYINTYF